MRNSKKRNAILDVLNIYDTPLTIEEIYHYASDKISLDISTVYRSMYRLEKDGTILKSIRYNGVFEYQLNKNNHQHVLRCVQCNKSIVVTSCPLTKLEEQLSQDTGYTITGHNLDMYGLCPKCQK